MTRPPLKSLLLCLSLSLLGGCAAEDQDIVIHATSNIFHPCGTGKTWFTGYFGQYYVEGAGCNGAGSNMDYKYDGPPQSPIIFRWTAVYEDPDPKKADVPYKQRVLNERYFYAETHEPVDMPPRRDDHWLYEVHISVGPRAVFSREAVAGNSLRVIPYKTSYGGTKYQVGEDDTLYYFVRSRPRTRSPDWPLVNEAPYRFHAVKGIELTKTQYMTIACERVGTDTCDDRLEEDAPGLTPEQLTYLRAVRSAGKESDSRFD